MTEKQDNLTVRLNKVEGQVRGIKKLIISESDLYNTLIQINAAKSALSSVGRLLLERYAKESREEGEDSIGELIKIIEKTLK